MTYFHGSVLAFVVSVALLGLSGCAGQSDLMVKAPAGSPSPAPSPDAATIVFIRDSTLAFAVNFSIVTHDGQVLGDGVAKSHFAVKVPPGLYYFAARSENTSVVRAEVAAGGIYYLHVVPLFGAFVARVNLDPVKPSEADWRHLPIWLRDSHQLVPKLGTAPRLTPADPQRLSPWVTEEWSKLGAAQQAERTVTPNDGARLSSPQPAVMPPAVNPTGETTVPSNG